MIKKRINTDLFLSLAIKDAQGADVDMSAATDIEVYVRSQKSLKRVTHAFAISANVVSLQYSADENQQYGKHNVTVEWNDPDPRSKTGIIHKAVDFVSAFEIVESTAMEENVEVTLNGIVYTFGAPGKSLQYSDLTPEQIAELQKPATDAAVLANEAADNANKVAKSIAGAVTLATDAAARADKAVTEAETAVTNANNAVSNVDKAIADTQQATEDAIAATKSATDAAANSKATDDAIKANETARNTEFATLMSNSEAATTAANDAAKKASDSATVTNEMIGNSTTSVISQKTINDYLHLAKEIDLSEVAERGGVDIFKGSLISSTKNLRYELAVNSNNDLTITYNNIRTDGHKITVSWCYLDSNKSNPDHIYVERITIPGEIKIVVPSNRPYMRFVIYESDGSTEVTANLSKGELVLNNGIENLVVQEHGFSTEKTVSQYGISKIAYGAFDQEDILIYEDTSGVIHKKKFTTAPTSLNSLGIVSDSTVRAIYAVPDVSKMTNLCFGFSFQKYLEYVNLRTWNTSNVTTVCDAYLHGLFASCTNLTELDFSTWDWSKVTGSMIYFLANDINLKSINLGTFDMGNITNFTNAFSYCTSLINIKGTLSNIKVSLSFQSSPLTEASAMVVINGLADLTGETAQTLTLSSTTKALLTDADKLIATNKNWTIA